jgi:hypothetical protein
MGAKGDQGMRKHARTDQPFLSNGEDQTAQLAYFAGRDKVFPKKMCGYGLCR